MYKRQVPEEPQPNLYFHPYIGTYIIYIWGLSIISYQVYFIYQRNGTTKSDPLYRKLIPFYEPILLFLFSIPYAATAYVVRFELVAVSYTHLSIVTHRMTASSIASSRLFLFMYMKNPPLIDFLCYDSI